MSAKRMLRDAIEKKEMTAFIGAGLSRRADYPAWSELLAQLASNIGASLPLTDDALWNAEEIRLHYLKSGRTDADFRNDVAAIYQPRKFEDPVITTLVRLPFRNFITTNYDTVIEQTNPKFRTVEWSDEAAVRELITNPRKTRGVCLHIHGCYDRPESIVLCESDYSRRYVESLSAHRKLFALLATQRLAFFGFSLGDPAFEEILRVSRLTLGTGTPRHFAVLPLARTGDRDKDKETQRALRQRLNRKYDIEPIFFTHDPPDFPEFADVVHKLAKNATTADEPRDAVDPNRGRFGGKAIRNGRTLSAVVTADKSDPDWFEIHLRVESTKKNHPITSPVTFHLHPTFVRSKYDVAPKDGVVEDRIWAWGAFTVGAEIRGENTRLELDLAAVPGVPKRFAER